VTFEVVCGCFVCKRIHRIEKSYRMLYGIGKDVLNVQSNHLQQVACNNTSTPSPFGSGEGRDFSPPQSVCFQILDVC